MTRKKIEVFFHRDQLKHKPMFEWAFGEKLEHPETTARAESIFNSLRSDPGLFDIHSPVKLPLSAIRDTHNRDLITLFQAAEQLAPERTFYPSIFPRRDKTSADPSNVQHAGYYCYDSGTPLNSTTWSAAAWSAACAFEAAQHVATARSNLVYALCRPPGHHASRNLFGGYCYFNNAAIAAKILRKAGKVFILDIDFHHGNGTQSLFYRDPQVFFSSIHGDPREYYPFYWGHPEETGEGDGKGYTMNITLPKNTDGALYARTLEKRVLPVMRKFRPDFLVLSAGFDTYKDDPVGDFDLDTPDYALLGSILGRLRLPTVVVQEGGYHAPQLGKNVQTLLAGISDAASAPKSR